MGNPHLLANNDSPETITVKFEHCSANRTQTWLLSDFKEDFWWMWKWYISGGKWQNGKFWAMVQIDGMHDYLKYHHSTGAPNTPYQRKFIT